MIRSYVCVWGGGVKRRRVLKKKAFLIYFLNQNCSNNQSTIDDQVDNDCDGLTDEELEDKEGCNSQQVYLYVYIIMYGLKNKQQKSILNTKSTCLSMLTKSFHLVLKSR